MDLNTLIFSLSFFLIESRLSIVLILMRQLLVFRLFIENAFLTLIDFLNVEGSLFLSNALIIWLTLILSLLTHLLVVIFDVLL